MAIAGKKLYSVYLTESEVEYLKARMETRGPNSGGLSSLLDDYVCRLASVVRSSGHKPGTSWTWAKVGRMAIKGLFK